MKEHKARMVIEFKTKLVDEENLKLDYEVTENTMNSTGAESVTMAQLAIDTLIKVFQAHLVDTGQTKEDIKRILISMVESN